MFGIKDNGDKPPVADQTVLAVKPGETFVLLKDLGNGQIQVAGSADLAQDTLALVHLLNLALVNLTGAMITQRKKESRIIPVAPGTFLR